MEKIQVYAVNTLLGSAVNNLQNATFFSFRLPFFFFFLNTLKVYVLALRVIGKYGLQ